MANHIRLGQTPDPVDSMFTQNVSIDLTSKVPHNDPNAGSLTDMAENREPATADAAKPKAVPVHAQMGQNVSEFDPTTVIPKTEKADTGTNEIFAALDMAVAREKQSITERHQALEEKMYEDYLEHGDDVPSDPTTSAQHVNNDNTDDGEDIETYDDSENDAESHKNIRIPASNAVESRDGDLYDDENSSDKYIPSDEENIGTAIDSHVDRVENTTDSNSSDAEDKVKPVTIRRNAAIEFTYNENELESDLEEKTPEEISQENQRKQEEEMNNLVEGLKSAAKDTIFNSAKGIDLSQFQIASRGVKASTVILKDTTDRPVADWVMYSSGHPISMSGLTGPELIKLDPENSTRNRRNTLNDIYKIIYDHVVDAHKPPFETWMKQTKYSDLDHIYFALYMATFNGSNFISYQCPDCHKVFIKSVNFEDMVVYKDDNAKKRVHEILDMNTDVGVVDYDVDLIAASDKYVFGMRSPSLYTVAVETAGLPDSIVEKYSDLIDTITYIDSVYTIDYVNRELIPVIIPSVKGDPVKSSVKRIKSLYDILRKLTSDEFYVLRGYIAKKADEAVEVSYKIPGARCPEADCDKEIPDNDETSASAMLFTRHHLGAFANM